MLGYISPDGRPGACAATILTTPNKLHVSWGEVRWTCKYAWLHCGGGRYPHEHLAVTACGVAHRLQVYNIIYDQLDFNMEGAD